MSDQELRDKLASDDRGCAAEEWPLSKNWWLHIQSCPGEKSFEAFDFIKIEAHGPNEYRRPITSIMVPKIDGFVCQSHSFIAALIHQNTKAVEQERDQLRVEVERLNNYVIAGYEVMLNELRAEVEKLNLLNAELKVTVLENDEFWKAQCEKLVEALEFYANANASQRIADGALAIKILTEYRKNEKGE